MTIYTSSDVGVTAYFAYVSGENIELAKAELDTLIFQFVSKVEINWKERLAEITTAQNPSFFLLKRAALVQIAGTILYECNQVEDIVKKFSDDEWICHISNNDEFSVRTLCVEGTCDTSLRNQIETSLGQQIKKATSATVNLRNPTVQIHVLILPQRFLICKSQSSELRAQLRNREPGKKTFFHPSMMNSTLARVMCNLAGVKPGEIVLDPFCGGGGILCEASYIGSSVIGIDLSWKLLVGAIRNLREITNNYSIIQGDAQYIPIKNVDRIVTDPPYGRSSSTRGSKAIKLVESILNNIDSILITKGECCCLCTDSEMNIPQTIKDFGLTIGRRLTMRVHSGLLREIITLKI